MPEMPPDFPRLLDAARGGSSQALGQLLEAFRPYLRVVASLKLSDELRARHRESDFVQETLALAVRHFHAFQGTTEANLRAWLRRILANRMADAANALPPAAEVPLHGTDSDSAPVTPADTDTPSDRAIEAEEEARLRRAVERLPPDYQEVIRRRYRARESFGEIGRHMGLSEDAASKLCARAVKQLTRLMRPTHESR